MFKEKIKDTEERIAKSLNYVARKKENERIEHENFKFAKRLLERPAFINTKGMDREYEQHLKYKTQIMKVPLKRYNPEI